MLPKKGVRMMALIERNELYKRMGNLKKFMDEDHDVLVSAREVEKLINLIPAVNAEPIVDAIWQYYTNDEGKARWRCSHCGKICHKHPHDKQRCSVCGAHMKMEG
jgi:hypothetical protein